MKLNALVEVLQRWGSDYLCSWGVYYEKDGERRFVPWTEFAAVAALGEREVRGAVPILDRDGWPFMLIFL